MTGMKLGAKSLCSVLITCVLEKWELVKEKICCCCKVS